MYITAKRITSFLVVIVVSMLAGCALIKTVNAEEQISWTNAVPKVIETKDMDGSNSWKDDCRARFHGLKMAVPLNVNDTTAKTDCLVGQHSGAKIFSYASYQALAVQFPGDTFAYPIGVGCLSCVYIEAKDIFINIESNNDIRSGRVVIYKNFLKRLHFVNSPLKAERYYSFDSTAPDHIVSNFYGAEGYVGYMKHIQRSPNGKWLVVEFTGTGLFRVDLDTMEMLKFSDWHTNYWSSRPFIEYDVTNDGRHIAVFGENTLNSIFDIVPGCGNLMPATLAEEQLAKNQQIPCPELNLNAPRGDITNNTYMPRLRNTYQPEFNDDGGEISFYASSYDPITPRRITLQAANYTPSPYLDYLALGDSYSSGEGDIEKKPDGTSYYTPVTDYNGGCHLSERSYPFILRAFFSISKMQSVACGGARMIDISQYGNKYIGQGDRLKDLSDDEQVVKQARALEVFNPGYIEQVKFVEKYKPKAITLTIGGNDVGFANIIEACAKTASLFTCSQAQENGLRGQIGEAMRGGFVDITQTIKILQLASPKTKIFLLGYPQFVYSGTAICGLNVGVVDSEERLMMTEGVKYMNDIIEAAARTAGAVYLNIENSLDGGRLCEAGGYVTGVQDVGIFNNEQYPSTFHPNAKGHAKIADAIIKQLDDDSLFTYPYTQAEGGFAIAPPPTPYFANAMLAYSKSAHHEKITSPVAIKGSPMILSSEKYKFKPGSIVTGTLHSNSVDLGTFNADSDGGFSVSHEVPTGVPVGYHTLVLAGETYSGEPAEIYQVIEIQGANPNDRDEDGINDISDPCRYIVASYRDRDGDGIDDACDPEISEPKEPYRVRIGNPSSQYNGTFEKADRLYIERNLHASFLTGISGDYDSNHDGWVVVATNEDFSSTDPYAKFWVDNNKVPHISFRTRESGCVQYRPVDLSKVTNDTLRVLTREHIDTNTCRQESVETDSDGNGLPDNTQPLYRARNGDLKKGENPDRLYLERSTRAAEAQLGKSDYSLNPSVSLGPTDTTDRREVWSQLASTQSAFPPMTYKRLTLSNNQPYIIATDLFRLCYAYKPSSLATIKKSTQLTRQLELDLIRTLTMRLQCGV